MHDNEPKIIINLNLRDSELEEKVKIATDRYINGLASKSIDEALEKIIINKIDYLFGKAPHYSYSKIGNQIERVINQRCNEAIEEVVTKLIAKKISEMIKQSEDK